MMKIAVIGSRGFNDYDKLKDFVAKGADSLGERWANNNADLAKSKLKELIIISL